MKFGLGINLNADITKDSTKIGADAVITHEGVVEAGHAGVMSAANGLKSMAGRVKSADLTAKAGRAVEIAGTKITSGAKKVTEVAADKTPAMIEAVSNGLHKVADKLDKPEAHELTAEITAQ